jgi:hypothetical protein
MTNNEMDRFERKRLCFNLMRCFAPEFAVRMLKVLSTLVRRLDFFQGVKPETLGTQRRNFMMFILTCYLCCESNLAREKQSSFNELKS